MCLHCSGFSTPKHRTQSAPTTKILLIYMVLWHLYFNTLWFQKSKKEKDSNSIIVKIRSTLALLITFFFCVKFFNIFKVLHLQSIATPFLVKQRHWCMDKSQTKENNRSRPVLKLGPTSQTVIITIQSAQTKKK